jgi:hypothetical protein
MQVMRSETEQNNSQSSLPNILLGSRLETKWTPMGLPKKLASIIGYNPNSHELPDILLCQYFCRARWGAIQTAPYLDMT